MKNLSLAETFSLSREQWVYGTPKLPGIEFRDLCTPDGLVRLATGRLLVGRDPDVQSSYMKFLADQKGAGKSPQELLRARFKKIAVGMGMTSLPRAIILRDDFPANVSNTTQARTSGAVVPGLPVNHFNLWLRLSVGSDNTPDFPSGERLLGSMIRPVFITVEDNPIDPKCIQPIESQSVPPTEQFPLTHFHVFTQASVGLQAI